MTLETEQGVKHVTPSMLTNGLSYAAYREKIDKLFAENLVTGHEQRADYLEYTKMNQQRMSRWDKHFVPSEEIASLVSHISRPQHWIMITEGWCGDSAQIIPAAVKIAALNPKVTTTLFLRDENPDLMNLFLTGGKRSIPIIAALDEEGRIIWKWGPRPVEGQKIIDDVKSSGEDIHMAKERLQLWYARNKQEALMKELSVLISGQL